MIQSETMKPIEKYNGVVLLLHITLRPVKLFVIYLAHSQMQQKYKVMDIKWELVDF